MEIVGKRQRTNKKTKSTILTDDLFLLSSLLLYSSIFWLGFYYEFKPDELTAPYQNVPFMNDSSINAIICSIIISIHFFTFQKPRKQTASSSNYLLAGILSVLTVVLLMYGISSFQLQTTFVKPVFIWNIFAHLFAGIVFLLKLR